MGSRTWIKVYVDKWLEGTISDESINVRGVWIGLLALAGNGKYGDSGRIMALDRVGFTDQQLTLMLKIGPKMWGIARNRFLETGMIDILGGNIIHIINWKKYQSEYERTKSSRTQCRTKSTTNSTARDRDKRIENKEYKESVQNNFDIFWKAYPKKVAKAEALKAFKKINPDSTLLEQILTSIDCAKKSRQWVKDKGEYIPHPATWLRARRWEDEIKEEKVSTWE